MERGTRIKLELTKGHLKLPRRMLASSSSCEDQGSNLLYNFAAEFDSPAGAYEWKLHNLFGRNFNESALILVSVLHLVSGTFFHQEELGELISGAGPLPGSPRLASAAALVSLAERDVRETKTK